MIQTVEILNPPTFYIMGKKKPKKYYLTSQLFYSGIHFSVRTKIVKFVKALLVAECRHLKPLEPRSTVELIFSTSRKITSKTAYDIDNRGYFFGKMLLDVFQKELNLIPNDNVWWVQRVVYTFDPNRKDESIVIKIY